MKFMIQSVYNENKNCSTIKTRTVNIGKSAKKLFKALCETFDLPMTNAGVPFKPDLDDIRVEFHDEMDAAKEFNRQKRAFRAYNKVLSDIDSGFDVVDIKIDKKHSVTVSRG